jgi:hypothetical protein
MPDNGACADFNDVPGSIIISLYPNPVVDKAVLKVKSRDDQQIDVRVVDMEGRIQLFATASVLKGVNTFNLNTTLWARGVYFLEITNRKKERFQQKILKL